jgi:Domain of unknown function DUF488
LWSPSCAESVGAHKGHRYDGCLCAPLRNAGDVGRDGGVAWRAHRSHFPVMPSPAFDLFTVGHSNHPIERFLALLSDAKVEAIVDVRSKPFSRRFPWFSQTRLERLRETGISYLWRGEALGGRPADPALMGDGVADYAAMAATPAFHAALDAVIVDARKARSCLMCAEREPLDCHRCLLVGRALAKRGLAPGHILADGTLEPHAATEDRLLALAGEKADLFRDRATRLEAAYRRRARAIASRIKP